MLRLISRVLTLMCLCLSTASGARAALFSYASQVANPGGGVTTEELFVALGPPDYLYTVDALGAGVSVILQFPAPIDDVPGTDLLLYIFVTGQGTESSTVRVEGRAEPNDPFVEVATLITADVRTQLPFYGFDQVHVFEVDFDARVRKVIEVRITNIEGDKLNLDALEAVHPALASPDQAAEMRIFRDRDDQSKRFALRFKNIGNLETGAPMSGFAVAHTQEARIDQTNKPVVGPDGQFDATPETTAGPDNGETTQRTEYVWSVAGEGLDPGEVAAHDGDLDTDTPGDEFLENMLFTVTFLNGISLTADFSDLTTDGAAGQLYLLYHPPPEVVSINGPRPAIFYEFATAPIVAEDPCLDCVTDDNTNQNDNVDNSNDNDDNPPDGNPPRMCGAALIAPLLISLFTLTLMRSNRRVRR